MHDFIVEHLDGESQPDICGRLTASNSNEALWHRLECCLLWEILLEIQVMHEDSLAANAAQIALLTQIRDKLPFGGHRDDKRGKKLR